MKKIGDKIALVALIVIGMLLAVLTVIYPIFIEGYVFNEGKIILIVLSALFLGVGIYLLWSVFSSASNVKTLTLFSDKESTTQTSLRVVKGLVADNAKRVTGASVKKVRVSQRDNGVRLYVVLNISGADVEETVDTMRCLIADTFVKVLGIRFDIIDFKINRIKPRYIASEQIARQRAEVLHNERKCSDKYHEQAVTPIFEEAEAERDAAEQAKAEQVTEQAKQNEQPQQQPSSDQQTEQEEQQQPIKDEPQGKRKSKGKRNKEQAEGEVVVPVQPDEQPVHPTVEAVTVEQGLPSDYQSEMERVSEEEIAARNAQEQERKAKELTDAEFTITDDDKNKQD